MDTVTEWRMAVELARIGAVGVIHRNMSTESQVEQVKKAKAAKVEAKTADEKGRPLVGASVSPLDTKRCEALDKVADFLVSDVAHFHNSNLLKVTAKLLPNLSKDFIAGNIGTRRAVRDIIAELPRVDGFRVGIGSGSVCITSEVTRVGAPTLFAVSEVATAVSELNADVPDNRGRRDSRGGGRLARAGSGGVHGDARLDARGLRRVAHRRWSSRTAGR